MAASSGIGWLLIAVSLSASASAQSFHPLRIEVRDPSGLPLQARVRVMASSGTTWPQGPDPTLLSHLWAGGTFFYVDGAGTVVVPAGFTRVTVSRGPEWTPFDGWIMVDSSQTIPVTLERFANPGQLGWYSGDMHVHSRHGPGLYPLAPTDLLRIARGEGLHVMNMLDDAAQVTGEPDPISDAENLIYQSIEVRNQTCGHAALPGLATPVGDWCCQDPLPAWPMLVDLREEAAAQGALLVLAHPHTTDDFEMVNDWPGCGLGRELPVLAALGSLDALDVLSISNEPDEDWSEWYDLLSAGLAVTPTAGTDAVLHWWNSAPPGIWRVYANVGPGHPLDYHEWLDAVRQGRTFVTNLPLITAFSVAGRNGGETLEVPGDSLIAEVRIQASCAIGLQVLTLVADGVTVWTCPVATPSVDTTFTLRTATPAWIAARVEGPAGHPVSLIARPIAHTNAVRITQAGIQRRRAAASARWLSSVDRFERMVLGRGHWGANWQRDSVAARIERARDYYGLDFPSPPDAFQLVHPPPDGTTADVFRWTRAADSDPGDSVTYRVRVGEDSTLTGAWEIVVADTALERIPLDPQRWYWWSVEARDRGRKACNSSPAVARFWLSPGGVTVSVHNDPATADLPRAVPSPAAGPVRLLGLGDDASVYDVSGRRVARLGLGIRRDGDALVWDGTWSGRTAPPGVYWAVSEKSRRQLRLVKIARMP